MDSELVKLDRVSKVYVDVAGDNYQHEKEGRNQDYDMVLLPEQDLGESNADVVGTRSIGIAVLLEVFSGSIIS